MDAFGNPPLCAAAKRGALDEMRALLEGGADVNVRGLLRCTPLILAVAEGHLEAVSLLLQHGAQVDLTNQYGDTALDRAKAARWTAIMAVLEPPVAT